jgi:hypothetical protein
VLERGSKTTANNATNNTRNKELKEFTHNLIVGIIAGTLGGVISLWIKARRSCPRLDSATVNPSSSDLKTEHRNP